MKCLPQEGSAQGEIPYSPLEPHLGIIRTDLVTYSICISVSGEPCFIFIPTVEFQLK